MCDWNALRDLYTRTQLELTAHRLHLLMLYFQGNKLKETLLPSLNLLTESARIHRETRKFLRMKVRFVENSIVDLRDVFFFGNESVCLRVYTGASTITRCQKQTWGRERSTEQASASNDTHRHGREALCGWVPVCAVQGEWYVTLLLKIHKIINKILILLQLLIHFF